MSTATIELPEERITFSLLCSVCGERVDRQVNEDRIPDSLRCRCGHRLSLIGEEEWPLREAPPSCRQEACTHPVSECSRELQC